ncbi:MAG TPA: DNA mismatch repair protein MutS [Gammaproteobacteria bacterium]|nr:DNA mismatch repair protein MutS [Gammaproteobacteria bacterium]
MSDELDESSLFRQAIGDVRPVKHDRVVHTASKPSTEPKKTQEDESRVLVDSLSDEFVLEELQPGDELLYREPGLQPAQFRKLRRGEFRRDAELDLHGMTAENARKALALLLHEAMEEGWRCLRIIHGKGLRSSNEGPVLKTRLNTWLRQRKDILAFCSAPPRDGGTGAVYVLLRKR